MVTDFPKKHDEQLAKIQGSIVVSVTPVCNLWADFTKQGLRGDTTELIPADVVLKTIKATVSLVGNAFSYVNSQRRDDIVKALPKSSQANLEKDFESSIKEGNSQLRFRSFWEECHVQGI